MPRSSSILMSQCAVSTKVFSLSEIVTMVQYGASSAGSSSMHFLAAAFAVFLA